MEWLLCSSTGTGNLDTVGYLGITITTLISLLFGVGAYLIEYGIVSLPLVFFQYLVPCMFRTVFVHLSFFALVGCRRLVYSSTITGCCSCSSYCQNCSGFLGRHFSPVSCILLRRTVFRIGKSWRKYTVRYSRFGRYQSSSVHSLCLCRVSYLHNHSATNPAI